MKRTSLRTCVLLVGLLAVVAIWQSLAWTPSVGAAMVWLDDDPNDVPDPNEAQPESMGPCSRVVLDEDPNDVPDPNEAQPESTDPWSRVMLDEDPNDLPDPNEPQPESAGS